ncbi:MAG: endonuclease/exonuclease/phosphatase family protein [Akkermansiaceae bacterium]|nr:endonuclease/exonuclease/phosphatase family protein [Akkermansiaceae bacterium]MCP5543879.1 endonuclease/exonuclease/phosphatase family protein [Akkermansiaceae bacterium]MCP5547511.1 endonuclease/exonuclease/phosphatase family protein [Akkermansiaceae bacterium]
MKTTLQILAVMVSLGTFAPHIRCDHWTIRGWDFPRLQLFVAAVATLAVLLAMGVDGGWWDSAVMCLLAVAAIHGAVWMWPYTRLAAHQALPANGESALKVVVANVLMSNRRSDLLLDEIRRCDPDLFVAVETDQWWCDEISTLSDIYPHAVELPQDDTYGMVIRSRLPLVETQVETLVKPEIKSVHTGVRMPNGRTLRMHAVHPKPPFPDEAEDSTGRDAELLIVGRRVAEHDGPTIVLGDLNDVAWSRTTKLFQRVSGLLDPRIGRGFFSTFHAKHRWMRWPLDHVFFSRHFRLREMKRLGPIGSDHFPILADFSFEPENGDDQDPPVMDAGDEHAAERKIENARDR